MTEEANKSGKSKDTKILDFSRIEGDWEGDAMEERGNRFWIKITLEPSSERGTRIGTVRYGHMNSDEVACEGILEGIRANDPVYIVSERNPEENSCPDGAIRLECDPQNGKMAYEFTSYTGNADEFAAGMLTQRAE